MGIAVRRGSRIAFRVEYGTGRKFFMAAVGHYSTPLITERDSSETGRHDSRTPANVTRTLSDISLTHFYTHILFHVLL